MIRCSTLLPPRFVMEAVKTSETGVDFKVAKIISSAALREICCKISTNVADGNAWYQGCRMPTTSDSRSTQKL